LGVLISGDMVLPRISTNVSVIDLEPEANPLPLYLESIGRMLALPADTLVLPSHGKPFRGLHTRIGQLVAHHDERPGRGASDGRSLLLFRGRWSTRPPSRWARLRRRCAVLPVMLKRELGEDAADLHQTTFAMGEDHQAST
jgi:glyoxylase-like metal-dependent hydrolase (beta-lactamase superfamily II)